MKKLIILLFLLSTTVLAQFSYSGEITLSETTTAISMNKNINTSSSFGLAAHLEADYSTSPIDFRLVLDPSLLLQNSSSKVIFETGLSEAYGLWRTDDFDFSFGLEKLNLSYSRLSLPFTIEPVGKNFQSKGLLGARLVYYSDDWRFRPAITYNYESKDFGGVISVRKDFDDFELEANLVYLKDFSIGLGGSGSIADFIVYGEGWLMDNLKEARASLGISTYYNAALLTLEASYSQNPLFNSPKAFSQILGQINLPIEANSLDINAGLGWQESALNPSNKVIAALLNTGYSINVDDYKISINAGLSHTEFATAYNLKLSLSSFY